MHNHVEINWFHSVYISTHKSNIISYKTYKNNQLGDEFIYILKIHEIHKLKLRIIFWIKNLFKTKHKGILNQLNAHNINKEA